MEASATLPQAIDSLQSSTNCHLSFDCGPGQMISQDEQVTWGCLLNTSGDVLAVISKELLPVYLLFRRSLGGIIL
jgi:hypothetical protein